MKTRIEVMRALRASDRMMLMSNNGVAECFEASDYEALLRGLESPVERHVHYHVPPESTLSASGDDVRIEPAPLRAIHPAGDEIETAAALNARAEIFRLLREQRPDRAKTALQIARITTRYAGRDGLPDEEFWRDLPGDLKQDAFDIYDMMVDPARWPK